MAKLKGSHFVKNDFFSISNKHLHVYIKYVLNDSAMYQNVSTNSSCQVDFTMHALSQQHHF